MDMYQLKQIPSEAQIRKYVRRIVFGKNVFCPLLLWCWTTRIPVLQAQSLTHLSEVTVRHWYRQFRLHLPEEVHILERIVQLDEAYGRGWYLMMAKQIGTRKLAYTV